MDAPLIIKGRENRESGGKEKSKDFIVLLGIMKFKHEFSVEKVGILWSWWDLCNSSMRYWWREWGKESSKDLLTWWKL